MNRQLAIAIRVSPAKKKPKGSFDPDRKVGVLVLKFANEENTCPYSTNLLGSCESV